MNFDSTQRRRLMRAFLAAGFAWSVPFLASNVAAQAPVPDKEYKLITPAQKPQGSKIEVVEFFSYACPHCAEFEAPLRGWLKNKPKDVEFRAVPVIFRPNWEPLAKLHFTLESMGQADRLHAKVFHAMHGEQIDLSDVTKLHEWVGKQGVDMEKFKQIYTSFGIDAKMESYKRMARDYKVQFTPVIAINGKYITGPSMAVGPNNQVDLRRFFQNVDALIAQERTLAGAAPKKEAPRAKPTADKPKADKPKADKPA